MSFKSNRKNKEPVLCIQALRVIAAGMVLIFHVYWVQFTGTPGVYNGDSAMIPIPGRAGVDIFFIISGFIMNNLYIDINSGANRAFCFLLRRVIRIYPLYWLVSFFVILNGIYGPPEWTELWFNSDLWYLLGSMLLIPVVDWNGNTYPILAVGWSLNFEMLFYAYFSILLLLKPQWRFGLTIVALPLAVFMGWLFEPSHPLIRVATDPLILEFMVSACLGRWYLNEGALSRRWSWICFVCGALLLSLDFIPSIYGHAEQVGGDCCFWSYLLY